MNLDKQAFASGAEWMKKYFSWISVKERLPEEWKRILVGFLFYYKYYDREAESRRYVDIFTYKNGVCVLEIMGNTIRGMNLQGEILKLYAGNLFLLLMKY